MSKLLPQPQQDGFPCVRFHFARVLGGYINVGPWMFSGHSACLSFCYSLYFVSLISFIIISVLWDLQSLGWSTCTP